MDGRTPFWLKPMPTFLSFLTDLGRRIVNTTGEKSSLAYLLQKFSVAIQRGNAASVLGTLPPTLSPPLCLDFYFDAIYSGIINFFTLLEKKKKKEWMLFKSI